MPFVKRETPAKTAAEKPDLTAELVNLQSADADIRWSAARALGAHPEAVPALAAALAAEQAPKVREALATALLRVGNQASVECLVPHLRSPDAGLRAVAIEALQAMPEATQPFMNRLLADEDSDVRILALELVRGMPAEDVTRMVCGLLEREQHANVCAAAVDVLAEIGTPQALPALRACAVRFAGTPFLPFAVSAAIARISAES
jgi:HEAT repeat protein